MRGARSAMSAHIRALREAGYVCVPVEPTSEMLHAAAKAMSPGRRPTPDHVSVREKHCIRYKAMIAAAPRAGTEEPG